MRRIQKDHLDTVFQNDGTGRGKKCPVCPALLNWTIIFLTGTSSSVYKKTRWLMKLPHISYVYRKTVKMISMMEDKAYAVLPVKDGRTTR